MKQPFRAAVETLAAARGRVIVTGIGKSGHIGQKIAATFASTGTPAFFVHPSEASHGDLGMITRDDAIVAISWSGESVELGNILTYSRRFKVPLIAITSRADSALAKQSDVVLELPRAKEACPHGLAPTTSTTMQLAIGDCLAIALLEAKGFTAHDFKVFHPGGSLGAPLKFVADVMHTGDRLPLVARGHAHERRARHHDAEVARLPRRASMPRASSSASSPTATCAGTWATACSAAGTGDIMTRKPKVVAPGMLASAALEVLNTSRITALFVVDKGKPVGVVHVHDLLRAGVA